MSEDRDLLNRYSVERSEAAFEEYVQRHLGFVYATALRATYGDVHAAADICQQVFVKVARESGRLATHEAPMGWLYVSTRNAARTFMRSEHTRRKHEQAFGDLNDSAASDAHWETLRPFLDEAVDELSPVDREAVLLRFFENHPFAEIGSRLALSENAARMRVERAVDKLHGILSARGIVSTAAALGLTISAHAGATVPGGLAMSVAYAAHAAAGQAAVSAGVLTFMTTSKTFTTVLAAMAILGFTVCIHQWNSAQRAQKSAADAFAQTSALREELRLVTDQLRQLEKQEATRQAGETTPPSGSAVNETSRRDTGAGASSPPAAGVSPFSSPGYVEASQKRFIVSLARYGPLYQKLGLKPEQITAFERVLVEKNQSILDIWAEAAKQGISPNDPSILKMTSGPIATGEAELRSLLGSQFETYKEYSKTLNARSLVSTLAGNIYYTDSPLKGAQGELLAEVIALNTEQKKKPLVTDREGQIIYKTYTETDWEKVRQTAQTILSPTQLQMLQSLIEQQQAEARTR
jgi:RNA polymerase sigma factor (sigma-70 family)